MDIIKGKIGNALESVAPDHVVAVASDIYDESKEQYQSDVNNRLDSKTAYVVCTDEADAATKYIQMPLSYRLDTGGSIKIKMVHRNTADNVVLDINGYQNPLIYDGERASATNSWEDGETIEVYYDGLVFQANNVAGNSSSGDGVFDVSTKYPTSGVEGGNTYTLEGALAVLNTNLSAKNKKGGMSIKFIQSSDNKYVQYRLMSDTFNTTPANWQGLDDEPTAGSDNLVTSGGIASVTQIGEFENQANAYPKNVIKVSSSKRYKYALVDSNDRVISYLNDDDELHHCLKQIFEKGVDINGWDTNILTSFKEIENDKYVVAILDSKQKVLFAITKNGYTIIPKLHSKEFDSIINQITLINKSVENSEKKINILDNIVFTYNDFLIASLVRHCDFKDKNGIKVYELKNYTELDSENILSQDIVDIVPAENIPGGVLYTYLYGGKVHQIVGYYDIRHQLTIAYRNKIENSEKWTPLTYKKLDSFIEYDTHNYIALVVDNNGVIHVAANMHSSQLNYWRSLIPNNINSLTRQSIANEQLFEERVTYPYFIKTDNSLFFLFRYGTSGDGDEYILAWNSSNRKWETPVKLFDGMSANPNLSAYARNLIGSIGNIYNSENDYYEIFFNWRFSPSETEGCKKVSYIKTKDFVTFKNYQGNNISLPITVNTDSVVLDDVGEDTGGFMGLLNTFDAIMFLNGKTYYIYHRYDNGPYDEEHPDSSSSQIYGVIIDSANNTKIGPVCLTNLVGHYYRTGIRGDSTNSGISFKLGTALYNNIECIAIKIYFTPVEYNSNPASFPIQNKIVCIDKDTLQYIGQLDYDDSSFISNDKYYPTVLNIKENIEASPVISFDKNSEDYLLRYEKVNSAYNYDNRMVGFTPIPSELKIIKIKNN